MPPAPHTRSRVIAVIRALQLDAVMEALHPLGPSDVLVEQVRGYGRQKDHLGAYTSPGGEEGFLPKVRIEFVIDDVCRPAALEAICKAAHTGRIGDGKIFVHAAAAPPEPLP